MKNEKKVTVLVWSEHVIRIAQCSENDVDNVVFCIQKELGLSSDDPCWQRIDGVAGITVDEGMCVGFRSLGKRKAKAGK